MLDQVFLLLDGILAQRERVGQQRSQVPSEPNPAAMESSGNQVSVPIP